MISIVIPTYNEEHVVEETLVRLHRLRAEASAEIIVADGGSRDDTVAIARRHGRVVVSDKGRARQLNTGAQAAAGDILFFLHADAHVPEGALQRIEDSVYRLRYYGGGFSNRFSCHDRRIKLLGRLLHLEIRSREDDPENTSFFGDNGIFVRADVFRALGGFALLPIMEDFDFSRRMSDRFRVVRIVEPRLVVSSRRQLAAGFLRTHLQWLVIQRLFAMGVPARWLATLYPDVR